MRYQYNKNKEQVIDAIKLRAQKKNVSFAKQDGSILLSLEHGKFKNGEDSIPVVFKGKINEDEGKTIVNGKFSYGFNLYTLVIVAIILIIARFVWSFYQNQTDNMVLCGIVTLLLLIVIAVVNVKSKTAKSIINEVLANIH